jgi:hypothetical protein
MFRIPISKKPLKTTNLIFFELSIFLKSNIVFDFKLPKETLKFHLSTGIKEAKMIVICGFGFEILNFFSNREFDAVLKVLSAAKEYNKAVKINPEMTE